MKHILLLHGALGAKQQLAPIADRLRFDSEVVSLNFSGHGGAPFANSFGIDQFMAEVLDFLDNNQLEQVDIFGYSMGGYVALNLAALHPQRVRKIVTLGTKFEWTPESAAKETKMLDPEKIELKVPAFAAQLGQLHAPNDWKILLQKTAQLMLELGQQPPLTPTVLSGIRQEALICLGDADQMVGMEETKQAASALPNGRFYLLEQTPHPIEKVDTDKLSAVLRTFFN